MLKISQYPLNADGTPMDLEVGVLTDATGNSGARLTSPPVGPDNAPIDAKGLVLVDPSGNPVDANTPSDLTSSTKRSAWINRIVGPLHPKHFNAPMDGSPDVAALQAWWSVFVNEDWRAGFSMNGVFNIDQGLNFTGLGSNNLLRSKIDFGLCRINALTGISKMLTLSGVQNMQTNGQLFFVGAGGEQFSTRTCNVGLFMDKCALIKIDYLQGMNLAYGINDTSGSFCDSITIGKVWGNYCGSGSAAGTNRSLLANWSARADTGSGGGTGQRSVINVDTPPPSYVAVSGATAKQLLVEINGQAIIVTNYDPVLGQLTLYPWINGSAASGTLRYHFGAALVMPAGPDTQLWDVGQVDANTCGCGVEDSALFGSRIGHVHAEGAGSLTRLGKLNTSNFGAVDIPSGYSEGNTFRNIVIGSNPGYGNLVGPMMGLDTVAKDVDIFTPMAGTPGNASPQSFQQAFGAVTQKADRGGWHYRRKSQVDNNTATEAVDLTAPSGVQNLTFNCSGARVFLLLAGDPNLRARFGYDATFLFLAGTGANGSPPGNITFRPPVGHTINGGAVGDGVGAGDFVLSASLFAGPLTVFVCQTSTTTWVVYRTIPALGGGNFVSGGVIYGAVNHPGYVSGYWNNPVPWAQVSAGATWAAGNIKFLPFTLSKPITIAGLGVRVTTLFAGGNAQAAIYANNPATNRPTGPALCSTPNFSVAATGVVSNAVSAQATLMPGLYWMAINHDNGTAAYQTIALACGVAGGLAGSATLGNVSGASGSANFAVSYSGTFGTWPDVTAGPLSEAVAGTGAITYMLAA